MTHVYTTLVLLPSYFCLWLHTVSNQWVCASYLMHTPNLERYETACEAVPPPNNTSNHKVYSLQCESGISTTIFNLFIYLFGVLRHFQHCTGHITTGSWKGRGNQYIQFVRVLYCKLLTNGKQLPAFPLEAVPGIKPRPQR